MMSLKIIFGRTRAYLKPHQVINLFQSLCGCNICILRNKTFVAVTDTKNHRRNCKVPVFEEGEGEVLPSGALPGHVGELNLWTCRDATLSVFWSHGSGMRQRLPPWLLRVSGTGAFPKHSGISFPKHYKIHRLNKTAHCVAQWHKHILAFYLHFLSEPLI